MNPTDPEDSISSVSSQSLYEKLFGSPVLDDSFSEDQTREADEFDAYMLAHEAAEYHPTSARRAVQDAVANHYRGKHPFDYPIGNGSSDGGDSQ